MCTKILISKLTIDIILEIKLRLLQISSSHIYKRQNRNRT